MEKDISVGGTQEFPNQFVTLTNTVVTKPDGSLLIK
jgi:hypothetical protein